MHRLTLLIFPLLVGSVVGWFLYKTFAGYAAMFQALAVKMGG